VLFGCVGGNFGKYVAREHFVSNVGNMYRESQVNTAVSEGMESEGIRTFLFLTSDEARRYLASGRPRLSVVVPQASESYPERLTTADEQLLKIKWMSSISVHNPMGSWL
jgi:hypothetical protein